MSLSVTVQESPWSAVPPIPSRDGVLQRLIAVPASAHSGQWRMTAKGVGAGSGLGVATDAGSVADPQATRARARQTIKVGRFIVYLSERGV